MIPALITSTCIFAVAFIIALILWLSRRKRMRALQQQLADEKDRCKKANESTLAAREGLWRERALRKECESDLQRATSRVSELGNLISSYDQTNAKLKAEKNELQSQNTALAEDLDKVKFIASKMKKYICQCRNKIDYLSDQELHRAKDSRTLTFWTQNLGKLRFDYTYLTNYVTDKMPVLGGDVPAQEKFKRLQKAFDENMVVEQCDMTAAAKIKGLSGEIYETTLHSCTCEDFVKGHYKTPCKHMYRLVIELGMLTVYDRSLYENMRTDFQQLQEQKTELIRKEKNLRARENRLKKKQAEQSVKGADKKS